MYAQLAVIFMILLKATLIMESTRAHPLKHCRMTGFALPVGPRNQCLRRRARHIKNMEFDKKYPFQGLNNVSMNHQTEIKTRISLRKISRPNLYKAISV
jgi:hypothetical protein